MKIFKMETEHWHVLRVVFLVAGVFTLGSVLLGVFMHPYWFAFTGFVGFMQIFFALSGYCPMAIIATALGVPQK